jgi:hypothetical protein
MNRQRNHKQSMSMMPITVLAAVIAATVALAVSGGPAAQGHAEHAATQSNAKQAVFHDQMRALWEDHIVWTRGAIVSFAAGTPDFDVTAARLLRNQDDIGKAISPYYGKKAGKALTALLKDHILIAVDILKAAKTGDTAAVADANKRWYANADQIAAFLNKANPHNWGLKPAKAMMHTHLDQTLKEAVDRLNGRFAADIRDYDSVHRHILEMADMLSSGIVKQFPARFR